MATLQVLEARLAELETAAAAKDARIKDLVKESLLCGANEDEMAKLMGDLSLAGAAGGAGGAGVARDPKTGLITEVSPELLTWFFRDALVELADAALGATVTAKVADLPVGSEGTNEQLRERYTRIRECIDAAYTAVWGKYGVEEDAAADAVMNAGFTAGSDELDEAAKAELTALINDFKEKEDDFEGVHMLGEEGWAKRKRSITKMQEVQEDLVGRLSGMEEAEARKYVTQLQRDGMALQTKIQKMGTEAAAQYMDNPSEEDETLMMRFRAFQSMMQGAGGQGGGHGHSHGGVACEGHGGDEHGHSHAAPAPAHAHSHGGAPCDGNH